jgi:hypothetical protein
MVPLFDIFRIQEDGALRWCEAADSLESAKARVRALAEFAPAQYILVNQQTGQKLIIDPCNPAVPQPPGPRVATRRPKYHICRIDKENLRWVEQVEDLQRAEIRILELKSAQPADYLVLDYDPDADVAPPWLPLTCVLANYLITSFALNCLSL